jgi:hypothetical protein
MDPRFCSVDSVCLGEHRNKSFWSRNTNGAASGLMSRSQAPRQVHGSLQNSTSPYLITRAVAFAGLVQCLTLHILQI